MCRVCTDSSRDWTSSWREIHWELLHIYKPCLVWEVPELQTAGDWSLFWSITSWLSKAFIPSLASAFCCCQACNPRWSWLTTFIVKITGFRTGTTVVLGKIRDYSLEHEGFPSVYPATWTPQVDFCMLLGSSPPSSAHRRQPHRQKPGWERRARQHHGPSWDHSFIAVDIYS